MGLHTKNVDIKSSAQASFMYNIHIICSKSQKANHIKS